MKSILRYPGSKWNLAHKIIELFPAHKSYLEPFFGIRTFLLSSNHDKLSPYYHFALYCREY